MKYSEKYRQDLNEANKRKVELEIECNELQKKLEPLLEKERQLVDSLYVLDGQIRDLKRELRQALFDENFDEDGMYVEGINAQTVKQGGLV